MKEINSLMFEKMQNIEKLVDEIMKLVNEKHQRFEKKDKASDIDRSLYENKPLNMNEFTIEQAAEKHSNYLKSMGDIYETSKENYNVVRDLYHIPNDEENLHDSNLVKEIMSVDTKRQKYTSCDKEEDTPDFNSGYDPIPWLGLRRP